MCEFLETTNSLIRDTIKEYFVDNFDCGVVDDGILTTCERNICPILLLDLVLAKVRGATILFSAKKGNNFL